MSDPIRPQDVSPDKPVVDADEVTPPTPQGRTDNAGSDPDDGPSTGVLDATDGDDD